MATQVVSVIEQLRARLQQVGLSTRAAAKAIGVGADALERHLAGGYVRSDSLAKYRRWLDGGESSAVSKTVASTDRSLRGERDRAGSTDDKRGELVSRLIAPPEPHLVVDLFSGCGGMSLGFDALGGGGIFQTVLAIDVEEPMVRAFNANNPRGGVGREVCRQVDLSDFINEAEVLCFYLDHLRRIRQDEAIGRALESLPVRPFSEFKREIHLTDLQFLDSVRRVRTSVAYRDELKKVSGSLNQTSVLGFHAELGLPAPNAAEPALPPVVWHEVAETYTAEQISVPARGLGRRSKSADLNAAVKMRWDDALARLSSRAAGSGRGQLASSAKRIAEFLPFLNSEPMTAIRNAWQVWQSTRSAIRSEMFETATHTSLQRIYLEGGRRVQVLLGGPPCQGFSRIGRGKIRSLQSQQVHVHVDDESGDTRNRLLESYVLFVSALQPTTFLFENVRHFQAVVRTPQGDFLASEILADSIRSVSTAGLQYDVASRVIDASRHLVPETRERFFMAGVLRSDSAPSAADLPQWCLSPQEHAPIPLMVALEGLPAPTSARHSRERDGGLAETVRVSSRANAGNDPASLYIRWLEQPAPGANSVQAVRQVDAHRIRTPRPDDAALFELFGPGKRWMDYRCDGSQTVRKLRSALTTLEAVVECLSSEPDLRQETSELAARIDISELRQLTQKVDGSLSLRLLMDTIPPLPGELEHHLNTETYLAKREGNHGDWLARLAADRPCKTIMSHMAKDTYGYIHPYSPRTLSVREAARIQTFPDWFSFGALSLGEAFRVIGNAVPPLLSHALAHRVAQLLQVAPGASVDRSECHARAGLA